MNPLLSLLFLLLVRPHATRAFPNYLGERQLRSSESASCPFNQASPALETANAQAKTRLELEQFEEAYPAATSGSHGRLWNVASATFFQGFLGLLML